MALTGAAIRAAKAQEGRTIKLSDGGGLQLWVAPSGSKLWNIAYRYGGKQLKLSLGAYPAVGLKEAREQRDAAKRLLAAGVHPGQQKRTAALTKANAEANTFAVIAGELLAKKTRESEELVARFLQAIGDRAAFHAPLARCPMFVASIFAKGKGSPRFIMFRYTDLDLTTSFFYSLPQIKGGENGSMDSN